MLDCTNYLIGILALKSFNGNRKAPEIQRSETLIVSNRKEPQPRLVENHVVCAINLIISAFFCFYCPCSQKSHGLHFEEINLRKHPCQVKLEKPFDLSYFTYSLFTRGQVAARIDLKYGFLSNDIAHQNINQGRCILQCVLFVFDFLLRYKLLFKEIPVCADKYDQAIRNHIRDFDLIL